MEAVFDVEVRVKDLPEFEELAAALRRAEADRDAQHAEVLRLTGEARRKEDELLAHAEQVELRYHATLRERDAARLECEATRDLLTDENARLQARVATLELLRRGGE